MKGLLSRLAARASGTAVTVRSDARLALGGLAPVHSVADVQEPSLAFETRPAVPSAPPLAPVRSEASRDPPSSPIVRTASGLEPARVESASRLDAAADAASHQDGAASDGEAVNLPLIAPPRLVDYSVDQRDVNRLRSHSTDRSVDPRQDEGGDSATIVRVVREPPLLMPLAAADRMSAPLSIAGALSRTPGGIAQHAGLPDERDVHIHIGCVEVTAVHEPAAAPRRRAVSTPPPMSLDAYLAKRARG